MVEQDELMKMRCKSHMNRRDKRILTQFAKLVRQQFPDARIWAFGSRVKGTATQESDLDVCIVLQTLDEAIDRQIRYDAWQVGFDHELVISTVTYSTEQFEHGPCSQSSLVHNILTQGVRV
jgi:DNA polymerase sigma